MNMNDYRQALDKVTPRDGLKDEIISRCTEKPRITRSFNKRKLAPILAAAVIGCTSVTAAAAGGADWIKGFFSKDDIVITDEIAGFTTEISNFTCESDALKLSPVGMIADEKTLYAMFHIDSMFEDMESDSIYLKDIYSESYSQVGWTFGSTINENENNIVIKFSSNEDTLKNGDTLTADFVCAPQDDEIIAKVNFDITLGEIPNLDVSYDGSFTAPIGDVKCDLESMTINPLIVQIKGLAAGDIEVSGYTFQNSDITINMNDGTAVNATIGGYGQTLTGIGSYTVNADWSIDEPINPDNISSVYIGDLCLYTAQ